MELKCILCPPTAITTINKWIPAIRLQGINFKPLQTINLKNCKSCGIEIHLRRAEKSFVKETYHSEEIPTNKNIESITIKIQLSFKIHICNSQ